MQGKGMKMRAPVFGKMGFGIFPKFFDAINVCLVVN